MLLHSICTIFSIKFQSNNANVWGGWEVSKCRAWTWPPCSQCVASNRMLPEVRRTGHHHFAHFWPAAWHHLWRGFACTWTIIPFSDAVPQTARDWILRVTCSYSWLSSSVIVEVGRSCYKTFLLLLATSMWVTLFLCCVKIAQALICKNTYVANRQRCIPRSVRTGWLANSPTCASGQELSLYKLFRTACCALALPKPTLKGVCREKSFSSSG